MSETISLAVLDDMRLFITPQEIGRDAEHNSATFRVTQQPPSLDAFVCRAEIQTAAGTTYRLVENGEFLLTSEMTVQGINRLQLVYADGSGILRKTAIAAFHVSASLNAVDEGGPGFEDGLAQMQAKAFAQAEVSANTMTFRNVGGVQVDQVTLPGLDTPALDAAYLRRNGTNQMEGSVSIIGPNRGMVLDVTASAAAVYNTGINLVLRRPVGNADVLVENNNGDAGSRSPVLTQAAADARYDARYLQQGGADARYVQQSGGFLTGPLRQIGSPPPAFDDTLVTRGYVESVIPPPGGGGITQDEADARYLQLTGGGITGTLFMQTGNPFVSAMGTGSNPMLCIGTNDSGYWRSGASVIYEVGRTANRIDSATSTAFQVPVTMPGATLSGNLGITGTANAIVFGTQGRIYSPAAGIVIRRGFGQGHLITEANNGDVASRRNLMDEDDLKAVDRAPSALVMMLADLPLTGDFQNVFPPYLFSIPRGGNSRVRLTFAGGIRFGSPSQLTMIQLQGTPGDVARNVFLYSVDSGGGIPEGTSASMTFFVDVTGTLPMIGLGVRQIGTTAVIVLIGGTTDPQRMQVLIEDAGPRP